MRVQRFLVCWDEVYKNCLDIESSFKNSGFDISVINSGIPRDGWNNVGDIRYYRQFYYALKNFDFSNDYLLFICGDVSYTNWPEFLHRAENVLEVYKDVYLYAPHFTYDPWNFESTNLKKSNLDKNLSIATNVNGMMFFMHKDIVKEMLDFFDYFDNKYGWESMISGWTIDIIYSAITMYHNKIILRDSEYIITHPQGSSYDHGKATEESVLLYQALNEWNPKYNELADKINKRMSRDKNYLTVKSFYGKDFDLKIKELEIDYHIIHINDERKKNRDEIDKRINGIKHNIKCLNAKDTLEKSKFFKDNPDFYLSWDKFKDGEIGNFGSHYLAWKYVIENNLERLLIFEDDSILNNSFIEQYKRFLKFCPKDYDVFSMFVHENQFLRFSQSELINDSIAKGYQDWSTLCYVISNSGAKKLVEHVKNNGMDRPTDWFIFRNGHDNIFNVYTFPPQHAHSIYIDVTHESQVQ